MGFKRIDKWIGGHKVYGYKWIDGKTYYVNVQSFLPGAKVDAPYSDRSAWIVMNDKFYESFDENLGAIIEYVARKGIVSGSSERLLITL